MTDFTALKSQIEALIGKAAKSDDANDAMKFTQAATNAGQAMCMLRDIEIGNIGQPVSPAVAHMVDRFLSWKLPKNFNPDGGIEFHPLANKGTEQAMVDLTNHARPVDFPEA